MKKRRILLMLPLALVTGGLYINYWCHRTAKELAASGYVVSYGRLWKGFNLLSLILAAVDLLLSIAIGLGQLEAESEKLVSYLSLVSWGILTFQFRHIVNYDLGQATSRVVVGRFLTLFLSIFYLQAVLNRIHDLALPLPDQNGGLEDGNRPV